MCNDGEVGERAIGGVEPARDISGEVACRLNGRAGGDGVRGTSPSREPSDSMREKSDVQQFRKIDSASLWRYGTWSWL